MNKLYSLVFTLLFISTASANEFAGKWKTIDDKTGFSRADVLVTKNSNGTYSGKIVKIRPLPDKPLVETCTKCKGNLKDKPYVGLEIISGFKQKPDSELEYIDGRILDPLSGNVYHGKAKINARGNRITLRGYIGVSLLGRSTTWVRIN